MFKQINRFTKNVLFFVIIVTWKHTIQKILLVGRERVELSSPGYEPDASTDMLTAQLVTRTRHQPTVE